MKHTGINYGYDRPKELSSTVMGMSEAEKVDIARQQMAMYHGQDHEAKFRADILTRLGRIEAKLERLLAKAGA